MLQQNKCCHSSALPYELCSFCNSTAPEKLLDICFEYVNKHLETICRYDPVSDNLQLMEGVALPVELCERLLNVRSNSFTIINSSFINIFRNTDCTRLKRVRLRKSDIQDDDLEILLKHRLTELDISYSPSLTTNCIGYITEYGSSLLTLSIGENTEIFPTKIFGKLKVNEYEKNYIFLAPNLKRLSLKGLNMLQPDFYMLLLNPLTNLTHLDLSHCSDLRSFDYTEHLSNLSSLVLYNVDGIDTKVPAICKLVNLRHLDISQSKDEHGKYEKGTKILKVLVESLPKLTSLDISGTNLAGRGVAEKTNGCVSDIPGLSSRVKNPFQFLGLYETSHDACLRHDIPAKLVRLYFLLRKFSNVVLIVYTL